MDQPQDHPVPALDNRADAWPVNTPHQDIYAIIDLGSNSFHMLMVKVVGGSVQVIGRVKRKVRLAAGLNDELILNRKAMNRGWECLALFAERLQDIPADNIRVVGTATLRLARNVKTFLSEASRILGHPINVISGEEEARLIYMGVAYTSSNDLNRLVIDIGGASTEVIVGAGREPIHLASLDMGCVTFLDRYFSDGLLSATNFQQAIAAAELVVQPIVQQFKTCGWQMAVGASGTVQAIQEIQIAQGQDEVITLARLESIMLQAQQCQRMDTLDILGLAQDRKHVFASGLAILMALFRRLDIVGMTLSGGALREGILYGMLPGLQQADVRQQTVTSLMLRYLIDQQQAMRVADMALTLAHSLLPVWDLQKFEGLSMLRAAAMLHELGLLIEYKNHHHHAAYIISHTELPGFTRAQQHLLMALLHNHRLDINTDVMARQTMTSVLLAMRLTRILRLAVILSMRRRQEVQPDVTLCLNSAVPASCNGRDDDLARQDALELRFAPGWLELHPLMRAELEQEVLYQQQAGWRLSIHAG